MIERTELEQAVSSRLNDATYAIQRLVVPKPQRLHVALALEAIEKAHAQLRAYGEAAEQRGRLQGREESFGQDGHSLWFVVQVYGLPALPSSCKEVAAALARAWSRPAQGVSLAELSVSVKDLTRESKGSA